MLTWSNGALWHVVSCCQFQVNQDAWNHLRIWFSIWRSFSSRIHQRIFGVLYKMNWENNGITRQF